MTMTKVGFTSSGRSMWIEPRNHGVTSWKEDCGGCKGGAEAVGNDLNELREEDIWGGDILYAEVHKDIEKRVEETYDVPRKKGGSTRKLRSLLSVELEAAASLYPSGLPTFSDTLKDDSAYAGVGNERGACKPDMKISNLVTNVGEARQFHGPGGLSLSVPLRAAYWGDQLSENAAEEDEEVDGKDEEGGVRIVPPHVLVAREYAKSQAMAFSVFEGAGRTLKGMDLRRLRSAVWSKTGFMG